MKKLNNLGFFLVETMVVIAIVGIVITSLFKTFSNLYNRFSESEYYNTVHAINAVGALKQYMDNYDIDYELLLNNQPYVEITTSSVLVNPFYASLMDKFSVTEVYLINVQTFFADNNNLLNFNISLRGYLETLREDKAQYMIIIANEKNEFGSIPAFNYFLTLQGDPVDEYASYVGLNDAYTEPGYSAKDKDGNDLDIVVTGVIDTSVLGTYYLNYNIGTLSLRRKIVVYKKEYLFDYTGNYQTFIAPVAGNYKVELWGAQSPGGVSKGAYTTGNIFLFKGDTLYVYVGETNNTSNVESFNGSIGNGGGSPGGGATDVRLVNANWKDTNSLKSRIMVAAGAGSGNVGAHGGALTGLYSGTATGGTQTTPGVSQSTSYYNASFGIGGGGCGGGGGYYGGGGATCANGGAGGSSFISGHTGSNAIRSDGVHTGFTNHYSGYIFTDTQMIAGNASMPNPRGAGSITGNDGLGYAKITVLSGEPTNTLQHVRYIYNQINGSTANTSNHWVELQAYDLGNTNISSGNVSTTASCQSGNVVHWTPLTDGVITTSPYVSCSAGLMWVRLDLGAEYDLSSIRLWHYYSDGRTYYQNEVRVAGNDLVYTTVLQQEYPGSADGRIIRPVAVE